MLKKLLKNKTIRGLVRLIKSIIENDFYGMAAEMGFMLVIGIFPFMLFLTALFGWLGKHSFMNPLILFLQQVMPDDVKRTAEMFDILLGDNLQGRKDYIVNHGAEYVDNLDLS